MKQSKYRKAWNQKTIPEVEDLMRNGGSIIEACQIMGICKETFYRWLKDPTKTAFRRKMDELMEASEAWWTRQGRENLNNRNFNSVLYNLNMVNRFKWNSAQTEQTRIIKESSKKVDVAAVIEKAESEARKLREEGVEPELKVVTSRTD